MDFSHDSGQWFTIVSLGCGLIYTLYKLLSGHAANERRKNDDIEKNAKREEGIKRDIKRLKKRSKNNKLRNARAFDCMNKIETRQTHMSEQLARIETKLEQRNGYPEPARRGLLARIFG